MTCRPRVRSGLLAAVAILLAVPWLVLGAGGVAHAHTDFDSSVPADGETVEEPVEVVTLTFTNTAVPAGDAFIALNGDGATQVPTTVDEVDQRVFTLAFDPPLAGGDVAVRYTVEGADGHVFSGAVVFTVAAPAAASPSTTAAAQTNTPALESAPTSTSTTDASSLPESTTTTSAAPATADSETSDGQPAAVQATDADAPTAEPGPATDPAASDTAASSESLDAFLGVDVPSPGKNLMLVGRLLSSVGLLFALGAAAFMFAVLAIGSRDARVLVPAIAAMALVAGLGAVVEYVGVARRSAESIAAAWDATGGTAPVLRLFAAAVVLIAVVRLLRDAGQVAQTGQARSLSAATIETDTPTSNAEPSSQRHLRPEPLFAGAAFLFLASYWLDGHTVTEGPRLVHALSNSLHLIAAAIWVGGVFALALVAWVRSRDGRPAGIGAMVVRFSKVATLSLVGVAIGGAAMALMIVDGISGLTGSEWGRTLLVKLAVVGAALACGAYNHLALRPSFERSPDDPALLGRLRAVVTAEVVLLAGVVVVSAWLVQAAI